MTNSKYNIPQFSYQQSLNQTEDDIAFEENSPAYKPTCHVGYSGYYSSQGYELEKRVFTSEFMQGLPKCMPLADKGYSLQPDMKFGWKPTIVSHGVPIPLYYESVEVASRVSYMLNKDNIMYYGFRPKDSLEMHEVLSKNDTYPFKYAQCLNAVYEDLKKKYGIHPVFKKDMENKRRDFEGMNVKATENDLIFNSKFESGNLDLVYKMNEHEYDLYMRPDTNRKGKHQWFYFSVKNKEARKVRFNVVNFSKRSSLYQQGMKVCVFSEVTSERAKKMLEEQEKIGWHKAGTNIQYKMSKLTRELMEEGEIKKYYYTLSFDYEFEYENDTVYFAYCIPYTFSTLISYLKDVQTKQKELPIDERFVKETVLCKTISGLEVPLLTITNRIQMKDYQFIYTKDQNEKENGSETPRDTTNTEKPEPLSPNKNISNMNTNSITTIQNKNTNNNPPASNIKKKYMIIGARVHPGESCASWMMEGFVDFITGPSEEAKELRDKVIFKIIPMSNPDGVIAGNYRTSLSGNDLNRQYLNPDNRLQPTVSAIKKLISRCIEDYTGFSSDDFFPTSPTSGASATNMANKLFSNGIIGAFDLHGHSRKKGVFIYGPYSAIHSDQYFQLRVFPKLLSDKTSMFRFFSCKFNNERSKRKAARLVLWKQFNILNSFTIEASFHGYINKDRRTTPFSEAGYKEMGLKIGETLGEYLSILEEENRTLKNKREKKKRKIRSALTKPEETIISRSSSLVPSKKTKQKNNENKRDSKFSISNSGDSTPKNQTLKDPKRKDQPQEITINNNLETKPVGGGGKDPLRPKANRTTLKEIFESLKQDAMNADLDDDDKSNSGSESESACETDGEHSDLTKNLLTLIEGYTDIVKTKRKRTKKRSSKRKNRNENAKSEVKERASRTPSPRMKEPRFQKKTILSQEIAAINPPPRKIYKEYKTTAKSTGLRSRKESEIDVFRRIRNTLSEDPKKDKEQEEYDCYQRMRPPRGGPYENKNKSVGSWKRKPHCCVIRTNFQKDKESPLIINQIVTNLHDIVDGGEEGDKFRNLKIDRILSGNNSADANTLQFISMDKKGHHKQSSSANQQPNSLTTNSRLNTRILELLSGNQNLSDREKEYYLSKGWKAIIEKIVENHNSKIANQKRSQLQVESLGNTYGGIAVPYNTEEPTEARGQIELKNNKAMTSIKVMNNPGKIKLIKLSNTYTKPTGCKSPPIEKCENKKHKAQCELFLSHENPTKDARLKKENSFSDISFLSSRSEAKDPSKKEPHNNILLKKRKLSREFNDCMELQNNDKKMSIGKGEKFLNYIGGVRRNPIFVDNLKKEYALKSPKPSNAPASTSNSYLQQNLVSSTPLTDATPTLAPQIRSTQNLQYLSGNNKHLKEGSDHLQEEPKARNSLGNYPLKQAPFGVAKRTSVGNQKKANEDCIKNEDGTHDDNAHLKTPGFGRNDSLKCMRKEEFEFMDTHTFHFDPEKEPEERRHVHKTECHSHTSRQGSRNRNNPLPSQHPQQNAVHWNSIPFPNVEKEEKKKNPLFILKRKHPSYGNQSLNQNHNHNHNHKIPNYKTGDDSEQHPNPLEKKVLNNINLLGSQNGGIQNSSNLYAFYENSKLIKRTQFALPYPFQVKRNIQFRRFHSKDSAPQHLKESMKSNPFVRESGSGKKNIFYKQFIDLTQQNPVSYSKLLSHKEN